MTRRWPTQRLSELVEKVGSGATPKGGEAAYQTTGIPLIRSMNVVFFGFKTQGLAHISEEQAAALDGATVAAGDVLLNITGASIGRVTLAPSDVAGARVNQHVCIIRPNAALNARFLNAYLSSPPMQEQIWADNYGVTRQALTKQQILQFEVPLPPLPEQQRIADKLDTVLARVDACRDRLARVAPLLKRFRQSVLAAATSGRLTDDWRRPVDLEGMSEVDLPPGWARLALNQVGRVSTGSTPSTKRSDFYGGDMPFAKPGDLDAGAIEMTDCTLTRSGSEEARPVRAGAVLVSCIGNLGKVGLAAVPLAFNQQINAVEFDQSKVIDRFGYYSCMTLAEWLKENSSATTIAIVNKGRFEQALINVPSLAEQAEIVRRVETLFAFAGRLEARLTQAQNAVDRLTPSLLAKAFRGELVPQDPADEPAAELLKRLAAQRAAAPPKAGKVRNGQPA